MPTSLLKMQLLVILMGACPCLEDSSSDVPAPLSVMHWGLWFHILPDKVAIINRMVAVVTCLLTLEIINFKSLCTQTEKGSIHIF